MNRHFRELSVAAALGLLLLVLAIFAPAFYQPQPLLSLVTREAPTLVVGSGKPFQVLIVVVALTAISGKLMRRSSRPAPIIVWASRRR